MRKETNKMNNRFVNFLGSCALDTVSFLLTHSFTQKFIRKGRTHSLFYAKRTQFQPTGVYPPSVWRDKTRKKNKFYPKLLSTFTSKNRRKCKKNTRFPSLSLAFSPVFPSRLRLSYTHFMQNEPNSKNTLTPIVLIRYNPKAN
jgi:hypothetical protein